MSVVWDRSGSAGSGNGGAVGDRKRHKVMGFVGIQTGFRSLGRRQSLRKTWMPSDQQGLQRLEEATGLAFRFVIGRTKDKWKMSELRNEVEEYDDFLLLDIEEEYSNLPYKTLAFFKAAYALFDSEFYVKADDDIYLRPDRLSLLLAKERSHSQTYLGCMKKGPVFTDPKLKWYEPLGHLLGKEYFLHAYGPLYALSADVVASLTTLRNTSFRMFSNEDVTIGAWMLAMNVNHENNHALCEPQCTPSSIAVWDIPKCSGLCEPEKKLLELHQMQSCSNSPTLESDDD